MTGCSRSRVVGLLVATVFANGCGDTQGGPPTGIPASGGSSAEQASLGSGGTGGTVVVAPLDSGPITADQICPSLARAACEGARRCCSTFAGTDAAIADCLVRAGLAPENAQRFATLAIASVEGSLLLCRAQESPQPLRDVGLALQEHLKGILPS